MNETVSGPTVLARALIQAPSSNTATGKRILGTLRAGTREVVQELLNVSAPEPTYGIYLAS